MENRYYTVWYEGEETNYTNEGTKDQFFEEVAKQICFGDLDGSEVTEIVFDGEKVHYSGWQPDMLYSFRNEKGEEVWSGYFPEWEH